MKDVQCMLSAAKCLKTFDEFPRVGTIVAVKVNQKHRADYYYFNKFKLLYMGPWVIVEIFTNGNAYRVSGLRSEQANVLDIPFVWGKERERKANELPRLRQIVMGEGVVVPQTRNESVSKDSVTGSET